MYTTQSFLPLYILFTMLINVFQMQMVLVTETKNDWLYEQKNHQVILLRLFHDYV